MKKKPRLLCRYKSGTSRPSVSYKPYCVVECIHTLSVGTVIPNMQFHPDVAADKEVELLQVRCSQHAKGCLWQGNLKDLEVLCIHNSC